MQRTLRTTGLAVTLLFAFASRSRAWILGQPTMTVDPLYLDFQSQPLGTQGGTFTVSIQNAPGGSQLSYAVSLEGPDATDYQLSCPEGGSSCLSGWVNPGFYRDVLVSFAPGDVGLRQAIVLVTGTDSTNPSDEVQLTGFGVDLLFTDGFEIGDAGGWDSCLAC
jgi:hypothetical protein